MALTPANKGFRDLGAVKDPSMTNQLGTAMASTKPGRDPGAMQAQQAAAMQAKQGRAMPAFPGSMNAAGAGAKPAMPASMGAGARAGMRTAMAAPTKPMAPRPVPGAMGVMKQGTPVMPQSFGGVQPGQPAAPDYDWTKDAQTGR
jgi:hypothetical protein